MGRAERHASRFGLSAASVALAAFAEVVGRWSPGAGVSA
ncbi:hypothetical protein OH687_31895 [Burkholderia anthina]|nr:hypothetical protein OH687_31895 [Burkholderia anthina]